MLSQYRVLDLTDHRGHLAAEIWAQMGADVVLVEPPAGSSVRRIAPFAGGHEHPERGLHHWAYNRGKRSVVIDFATADGLEHVRQLAAGADVLFESADPGSLAALRLGYDDLSKLNPALIYVSITAFGSTGPKANWSATDLTIQAAAGNMAITGDSDRSPLRAGGTMPQAFNNGASEAAGAALIALWERQSRSGLGQHVDASAQQSMSQATMSASLAVPLGATTTQRIAGGANLQGISIQLMWPCADGHASVSLLFGAGFSRFTENLMAWVFEEGFCDEATRDKDWLNYALMLLDGREPVAEYERVKEVLTAFFATKTKAELLEASMTRRVLIAPVWTTQEVRESPQLAARDYWQPVDVSDVVAPGKQAPGQPTQVRFPGEFAKFSLTPLPNLRRAPMLGEHTDEVLAELRDGKARVPAVAIKAPRETSPTAASPSPPLHGVKVLDLMWAMAGPAASRVLADYGAEVIRVESERKIDAVRSIQPFRDDVGDPEMAGLFINLNAGKKGMALDISSPAALEVIWDLIDWADVVMESFSPKAMAGWGMSYSQIRQRRPDVIMTSSCLMGQTGPLAKLAGFGTMAAAISGFFYPVGWPDRAPAGPFTAYTDYTSPRWLVAAVMAALEHRRQTGEGQYVDFSQSEAALHLMAPAMLHYEVNGVVWERAANRDLMMVPHGAYQTAADDTGDDNWIAIACADDRAWQQLAAEIGATAELAALDAASRHERHDEIDRMLGAWARQQVGADAQQRLINRGVAAHVVCNSPEMFVDPQLAHRAHFVEVDHAKQGRTWVEGSRFALSRTPARVSDGGPTFGQHTFDILTDVLAYDGDHIADLAAAELLE